MGTLVGAEVGICVGAVVGRAVGGLVGTLVEICVGADVGWAVGTLIEPDADEAAPESDDVLFPVGMGVAAEEKSDPKIDVGELCATDMGVALG